MSRTQTSHEQFRFHILLHETDHECVGAEEQTECNITDHVCAMRTEETQLTSSSFIPSEEPNENTWYGLYHLLNYLAVPSDFLSERRQSVSHSFGARPLGSEGQGEKFCSTHFTRSTNHHHHVSALVPLPQQGDRGHL